MVEWWTNNRSQMEASRATGEFGSVQRQLPKQVVNHQKDVRTPDRRHQMYVEVIAMKIQSSYVL